MEKLSRNFIEYVNQALVDVEDRNLVEALLSGFHSHPDKLDKYCETYVEMTSNNWTESSLCTFFCGWRSPDGAAHAVSSIIVRILQESESLTDDAKLKMLEAARHCGEIIIEDVGLGEMHGHPHHSKLYYRMASAICGSDDWRLQDRYLDPITKEFSSWVGETRPLAPNLIEALEMMAMTELFNTGEYNLMTPMWKQWLREVRGYPSGEANRVAAFLSVHCGSVEARHFKHAAEALKLYASATRQPINYLRIERLSKDYVARACVHLGKMASVLKSEVPAWD
ncbi:hypothetical protein [Pseudomonas nunensis]|uniref:Uncharacterized protein n=1 Tax=Pseudomonas nunensis TaxID=2961896 RepID=A0ABY5ENS2_9PSED|nr:hypothetical protein [Pseudomonas nunensis]KPN89855.1 hypothetical protein AL066_05725 [Pseudomonas nunensis]MCL5224527.1 hypothetical protein [Pseudomonas nunensis]UTO16078.1 hypothetical protein NK667_06940 [Pseudomonas nunensis]